MECFGFGVKGYSVGRKDISVCDIFCVMINKEFRIQPRSFNNITVHGVLNEITEPPTLKLDGMSDCDPGLLLICVRGRGPVRPSLARHCSAVGRTCRRSFALICTKHPPGR